MRFDELLDSSGKILAEGSVYELLRREEGIELDSDIAHAALIYDDLGRERLGAVHLGYFAIARRAGMPLVALADTWRASEERIARSRFKGRPVNEDNVRFMQELCEGAPAGSPPVAIAGLTGPKGDAYEPREAPGRGEAQRYHTPQILALASAGVDLFLAATLPSVEEARGIADAMSETGVPYLLSFVVRPDGTVLDGTPLAEAIARIDDETVRAPIGFAVNCVHPTVFASAMEVVEASAPALVERVVWFQANTSAKSPEELDGSEALEVGEPGEYASDLAAAGRRFGIRVLGGCCGSDVRHIGELAGRLKGEE